MLVNIYTLCLIDDDVIFDPGDEEKWFEAFNAGEFARAWIELLERAQRHMAEGTMEPRG